MSNQSYVVQLNEIGLQDVDQVGGKNASLGEMLRHLSASGIKVPGGFATTAHAFREFLNENKLEEKIYALLNDLNVEDVEELARRGKMIREMIIAAPFSAEFILKVSKAYADLQGDHPQALSLAVRSSATAEDLPEASFAGQQETYLNVSGLDHVFLAIKKVFASLFNDRAIAYRVHHGFLHNEVALSAGVQQMVRSDLACSGVMFTLDTESGFRNVVFITASYGLGETVVQGAVNPDEFYLYKPALQAQKPSVLRRHLGSKAIKMIFSEDVGVKTVPVSSQESHQFCLTPQELETLGQIALSIETHYGCPMDIEWAKDGIDGQLYVVQARPETVKSRKQTLARYTLNQSGNILVTGRSIGQKIGQGTAKIVRDITEMSSVKPGDVLVTDMTDPDWEPIMKRASAIVTNRGGRTCHAAIIARELGIPAVVGCGNATAKILPGTQVTVSCAEGETGNIYEGLLKFQVDEISVEDMPTIPVKLMMNVGNPERAFDFQSIPNNGVGLARLEFIISNSIGIHPKALLNFSQLSSDLKNVIQEKMAGYSDPVDFYVTKLTEGIATIAAAFAPKPVIVRLSDFKSNEYANLIGGKSYEPIEENPMLGFRGASRYVDKSFRDCFALECQAIKRVREEMGLTNVIVMIPFVRTPSEARQVIELLQAEGLRRGENDLKIIMMCEIPSNAILAEEFLQYFDGFSIGSNDLTQLTLGLDRDSGVIAHLFDERDLAVKFLLERAIKACKKQGKYIGICGQGPSDHPDLAAWLLDQGIDTISLNPDVVIGTWLSLGNK